MKEYIYSWQWIGPHKYFNYIINKDVHLWHRPAEVSQAPRSCQQNRRWPHKIQGQKRDASWELLYLKISSQHSYWMDEQQKSQPDRKEWYNGSLMTWLKFAEEAKTESFKENIQP